MNLIDILEEKGLSLSVLAQYILDHDSDVDQVISNWQDEAIYEMPAQKIIAEIENESRSPYYAMDNVIAIIQRLISYTGDEGLESYDYSDLLRSFVEMLLTILRDEDQGHAESLEHHYSLKQYADNMTGESIWSLVDRYY